jgi:hypothetical protein
VPSGLKVRAFTVSGSRDKVSTTFLAATSHTFKARSRVAAARRVPSGAKPMLVTPSFGHRRVRSSSRWFRFHNFTVLSRLADARQRPSGLQATALTARTCPRKVKAGLALIVNHPWMVLSSAAAARMRPSEPAKANPDTGAWVGVRTLKDSWAVALFHTRTNPAELPAASHSPSALNATLVQGTTHSVCPLKVRTRSRVVGFQAITSPSGPAVTRDLPSGLKATAVRR